jgi:hypothetical protein
MCPYHEAKCLLISIFFHKYNKQVLILFLLDERTLHSRRLLRPEFFFFFLILKYLGAYGKLFINPKSTFSVYKK